MRIIFRLLTVLLTVTVLILIPIITSTNLAYATEATKLSWQVTANDITIVSPAFEIHVSKTGGISSYLFAGMQVQNIGLLIHPHGGGWYFTTTYGTMLKDPIVEQFERGVKIVTFARWDNPDYDMHFDITMEHYVYETGAVIISVLIQTWQDTPSIGFASKIFQLPPDIFKGSSVEGYYGGSLAFSSTIPSEKTWLIGKGFTQVLIITQRTVSIVYVNLDPIVDMEINWPYFIEAKTKFTKNFPVYKGQELKLMFLFWMHDKGEDFNKRLVQLFTKLSDAMAKIEQGKTAFKISMARKSLIKAEESIPEALNAIALADLSKAEELVNNVYNLARRGYLTEVRVRTSIYILIPLAISITLLIWAKIKWTGRLIGAKVKAK
ncbi:MAG: hypothetical protein DRJ66_03695 [Thermoprotei archaeon]|nr:MAG: hypothetical protein DRJ66_03695 [Thermoprotei archaeon]